SSTGSTASASTGSGGSVISVGSASAGGIGGLSTGPGGSSSAGPGGSGGTSGSGGTATCKDTIELFAGAATGDAGGAAVSLAAAGVSESCCLPRWPPKPCVPHLTIYGGNGTNPEIVLQASPSDFDAGVHSDWVVKYTDPANEMWQSTMGDPAHPTQVTVLALYPSRISGSFTAYV